MPGGLTMTRRSPYLLLIALMTVGMQWTGGAIGQAQEPEQIILKFSVNTVDAGEYLVWLTGEQDILMRVQDVAALGLVNLPAQAVVTPEGLISLASLAPDFTFTLDVPQATLHGDAKPALFAKQTLDFQPPRPANVFFPKSNSAVLNYQLSYSADVDGAVKTLQAPLEVALRVGEFLGEATALYTRQWTTQETDSEEATFVRMSSSVVRDDPDTQRRYLLGDTTIFASTPFGSSLSIGGFSVAKYLALNPSLRRTPAFTLSGVAHTPSKVEIYLNNRLFRTEDLPPGEFDLRNLPVYGIGDVTLVITDAFGRIQQLTTPFHLSANLLKPGLHDYHYALGFKREHLGAENFDYRDLVLSAEHYVGVTPSFTIGGNGEADQDTIALGATATWLPTRTGELNIATAFSYDEDEAGYALSGRYYFTLGAFSGNLLTQFLSEHYANLKVAASDDEKSRWQTAGNLSFSHEFFGSLSGGVAWRERYSGARTIMTNVAYSRALTRNLTFSASFARLKEDDQDAELTYFASVHFLPGVEHPSVNVEYRDTDGKSNTVARIQQTPRQGRGFGYNGMIAHEDAGATYGNLTVRYLGQYAETAVTYDRNTDGTEQGEVSLTGGLTLFNSHLYLSRPVTDSFAVVKVGDAPGILVQSGGQKLGVTNQRGEIFAPNLLSYYDNLLSLDPKNAPIYYQILESEKYASPRYRSGGLVEFGVRKLQTYEGTLWIKTPDGQQKPAEFGWLTLTLDGSTVESVIGAGGLLYLENMPSGAFPAEVALADGVCRFTLTIPKSDDLVVALGDVICDMN